MPQTMENSLPQLWKIKCPFLWKTTCRLQPYVDIPFEQIHIWYSLFYDYTEFELHGAKTERKYKSFYNRAKHAYKVINGIGGWDH